jgi:hypothetical protein
MARQRSTLRCTEKYGWPRRALTESISNAPPGTLADAIRRRLLNRELRKQLNIEEALLFAAEIAAKTEPAGAPRPVTDDWFQRYIEYVENVSDRRVREMWSTILARQFSASRSSVSLLTLDSLRLLEARHARTFELVAEFMASFGGFVYNHQRLDTLIDPDDLELLATVGLLDRRYFNDRKILFFRDGWKLQWIPKVPVPMLDKGILEYQLSYQGRELSNCIPNCWI